MRRLGALETLVAILALLSGVGGTARGEDGFRCQVTIQGLTQTLTGRLDIVGLAGTPADFTGDLRAVFLGPPAQGGHGSVHFAQMVTFQVDYLPISSGVVQYSDIWQCPAGVFGPCPGRRIFVRSDGVFANEGLMFTLELPTCVPIGSPF
jgi:hypothetical protein